MTTSETTLCVDIGATSLKACCVNGDGLIVSSLVRRKTQAPVSPRNLLGLIDSANRKLEGFSQVAIGFPGAVHDGRVISPDNLARVDGPGSEFDGLIRNEWDGFALGREVEEKLGKPTRVANDADVAALGCSRGRGCELTVTLGTGIGTGLVRDGQLQPHREFSDDLRQGQISFDELIGEKTRKSLTTHEFNQRVIDVLHQLDKEVEFDACYLVGGNAPRLSRDRLSVFEGRCWIMKEPVGLTGGIKLFSSSWPSSQSSV